MNPHWLSRRIKIDNTVFFVQRKLRLQDHYQKRRRHHHYYYFGRDVWFFIVFILYLTFVVPPKTCNGSDVSGSSFRPHQPPPPPPPRRSFASTTTTTSNTNIDDINDINNEENDSFGKNDKYTEQYGYYGSSNSDPASYSSSSSSLSSQPIHYQFPISSSNDNIDKHEEGVKRSRQKRFDDGSNNNNDDDIKRFNSARDDLVTRYWSRKIGKMQIQTSIALLGYAFGTFIAKSLIGGGSDRVAWTGYFCALFLVISTWFRTPLGELSRAIGLSLIIVLQRTQQIRSNYPTWRYVAASVGLRRTRGDGNRRGGPRPFPPAQNPWKYMPRSSRDPDFNMIYALISMALVGSAVGGNMPFIPSWMGALIGASIFSLACTWQNSPRGDLARSCAMRVVAACTELWKIQADLQIIPKTTILSSQIIDKTMILDRKHRVKDRFLSFASKGYESASKVAEQIQQQQRNRGGIDNSHDEEDHRDKYSSSTSSSREDERRYRRDNIGPADYDDHDEYYRIGERGRNRRRTSRDEDDYRKSRGYSNSFVDNEESNKFERRQRSSSNHEQRPGYRNYDERENGRRNLPENSGAYLDEVPEKKKSKGFFFRK